MENKNENKLKSKNNFLISIFKFSIATWVNFLVGIVSIIITTRIFDPETYGLMSVFNSTVNIIMYIVCLGLDSSYIRFYNEPPANDNKKQLLFKLLAISTISVVTVATIINIFFYRQFSNAIFGQVSWFISVMVFVSVFSQIVLRFLNITYRMSFNVRQYTIQNILIQVSTRLFVVLAALFNPTFETIVFFQVIGVLIIAIIYIALQGKDVFPSKSDDGFSVNFSFAGYNSLFKYAFFSAPTYVLANLNIFFSQQIIRNILGSVAVGIFSSVSVFTTLLNVMKGGFGTYWSAFMFSNYKTEKNHILNIHDYMMILTLFAMIALIVFKDLIYFFIGQDFHESKKILGLLIVFPILNLASETTVYGLAIAKKNNISLVNYLVTITTNLVISFILTPILGLYGAATASMISGITLFTLDSYFGQKYYKSIRSHKRTIVCVLLIIITAIVTTVLNQSMLQYIILLVIAGIGMMLYKHYVINILTMAISLGKTIITEFIVRLMKYNK